MQRVSAILMQVMGHRFDDDTAQLRAALDTISSTAGDAAEYLRVLERILCHRDAEAAQIPSRLTIAAPTALLVRGFEVELGRLGYRVETDIGDERIEQQELGPLVRSTIKLALEVATNAILARGDVGLVRLSCQRTTQWGFMLQISATVKGALDVRAATQLTELADRVRTMAGSLACGHFDSETEHWMLDLRLGDGSY